MKLTADEQRVCELKALDRADDERKEQAMNDAKHTKGPWIHSKHGFNVLTADEMHSICAVHAPNPGHTSEKDVQEHLANARLIAAAPDLLAVCEDILTFLQRSGYDTTLVRAAIRKAKEGRS